VEGCASLTAAWSEVDVRANKPRDIRAEALAKSFAANSALAATSRSL
jgi:hypothetical protein